MPQTPMLLDQPNGKKSPTALHIPCQGFLQYDGACIKQFITQALILHITCVVQECY